MTKTVPLSYKIHWVSFDPPYCVVKGYAIDSDLPVRICVHRGYGRVWVCDHYDTGYRFGKFHDTKAAAIKAGIQTMKDALANGDYERALRKVEVL